MTNKEYLNYSDFDEKVALIRISKLYRSDMSDLELYECTRGYWKRTIESISDVKLVLAIFDGIVKEVYKVESWQNSGFYPMKTMPTQHLNNRVEFVGKIAEETLRIKYNGKSVAHLYKKGEANPVKVIVPDVEHSVVKTQIRIRTEEALLNLLCNRNDYSVNTENKVDTVVLQNGKNLLDIYYRQHEIRINMKPQETLMQIYRELAEKAFVFQKESADPHSTKGVFAFFVKEENIETVLVNMLLSINDSVSPKALTENKVICSRCDYHFYKAKRCPICGQLVKYDGD